MQINVDNENQWPEMNELYCTLHCPPSRTHRTPLPASPSLLRTHALLSMRRLAGLVRGGKGRCPEAPEVFRVVDRPGSYARVELIQEEPPEELRGKVEAAVLYCPNRVISIVDDA